MTRSAIRIAATLVAVFGMVLFAPAAASAHSELESSSPSDGESVPAAPTVVILTFSAAVEPQFAQIAVTSDDDSSVTTGEAVVDGDRVDQAVRITAGGTYTISYRIVSADGHPVQGQLSFVYRAPAPTAVPGAAQPTAPTSSTSAAPDDTSTGGPNAAASSQHTDWLLLGSIGILVLGLLTVGIRLARRRQ